ncbi:MAG: tRNA (N(6)-L-threonylcarbamoyladenosine(37)-C(2))-methylthiotransferase MtaB, partial [Oscillospiraceae bacterium]|nr:tRNA (N(6)-L-threonylcarbamoyladenosine(37)-C(2))-methylthiotransferase MtaB [Oscillospiraceae bacterium]
LAFVEAAGFAFMHIFPFSARPGTPAASMPGRHTAALKRERAARASLLAGRLWRAAADACAGRTLNVLAETADGNGRLSGHAENYFRVNVTGAGDARGKIIRAKVTGTGDAALNAVRTAEV